MAELLHDPNVRFSPLNNTKFSFYHSRASERLDDITCVFLRMIESRNVLRVLDAEKGRTRWDIHNKNREIKVDMECLYFLGQTFLDQVVFMSCCAVGDNHTTFSDLVRDLSSGKYKGHLTIAWEKNKALILWLFAQFTVFRNKFVAHQEEPIATSYSRGIDHDDFKLQSYSSDLWIDEGIELQKLNEILEAEPDQLKSKFSDLNWRRTHVQSFVQEMLNHIAEFSNHSQRMKIISCARQVGFYTPSFEVVASNLLRFPAEFLPNVIEHAKKHPQNIRIGPPLRPRADS